MQPLQTNLRWLLFGVARIGLGLVLVLSSIWKLRAPFEFFEYVHAYELGGQSLGFLITIVLPWLEFIVGSLLLLGKSLTGALILCSLMLFAFSAVQWSAIYRGLEVACGCFDPKGMVSSSISHFTATRTTMLAIISMTCCGLQVRKGSPFFDAGKMR